MPRFATCRAPGCGARVMWIKTPGGKFMPVDVDGTKARDHLPPEKKNDVFVITTSAGEFSCEPKVHRSHWATCPGAGHFRNRQKSEGKQEQ